MNAFSENILWVRKYSTLCRYFLYQSLTKAFFRCSYSLNHLALFLTTFVVDRIMDSQDAHALIPRPLNMLPYTIKGTLQM